MPVPQKLNVISNPFVSELFISLLSSSVPSAVSAVKSFRYNRKRYYACGTMANGVNQFLNPLIK
jgi:hypothetical protein